MIFLFPLCDLKRLKSKPPSYITGKISHMTRSIFRVISYLQKSS